MRFLKRKHPNALLQLCVIMAVCMMALIALLGCFKDIPFSNQPGIESDYSEPRITLTQSDLETACENPSYLDLNQVTEKDCLITRPGCYILSGNLEGSIRIDVEDQQVHLVLNGVAVDSPHGPALEVVSAGKVFITLQAETENILADAGTYPKASAADACIYSPCDLTINGGGKLHVYGYCKDAIHSKDVLKVLGGELFIQAKRDGLRGNDGVVIKSGSLTVQSEENGIHTTKFGKETKGNIEIYDTVCSVIGGEYAISCSADLYIADSSVHAIGIWADIKADGIRSIAEGNLQHE